MCAERFCAPIENEFPWAGAASFTGTFYYIALFSFCVVLCIFVFFVVVPSILALLNLCVFLADLNVLFVVL